MEHTLTKGIYKLIKQNNEYGLIYDRPYLEVPSKIYGKSAKYATHFFNTFKFSKESCGVLLISEKGSGKTELSNMIGNVAINNDMFVVEVTNIEPDISIINFIDNLANCVVIFDEFGKVFNKELQDKMLTMFSNSPNKKFYVISDNNKYNISDFLIDRPGRIRYHLDMNRVEEDVVNEYCEDKGVSDTFFAELKRLYKSSIIFSFDHLKALVSEHLLDKTVSLDDIIKILNVKILGKKEFLSIASISSVATDNEYVYAATEDKTIERVEFDKGRRFYIPIKKTPKKDIEDTNTNSKDTKSDFKLHDNSIRESVILDATNVVEVNNELDYYLCVINNLKIKLDIKLSK